MAKSVKPTKVPSIGEDSLYSDWKKEIEIWQLTNNVLGCNKSVLAGSLFASLTGQAKDTVLSGLKTAEIMHDDGVDNIMAKLDEFFLGNLTKNAFQVHDDLVKFKRKVNTNFKDFLVEFQVKANKVKASGTELSEGVLGYILLTCANLSSEKENMIRATCDTLNFKSVKTQLEKIALDKTPESKGSVEYTATKTEVPSSSIKVENAFYENPQYPYNSDSSDEGTSDQLDGYYGYNSNGQKYKLDYRSTANNHRLNPNDKYNHVSECDFCHCIYHWVLDCPYAPEHVKKNRGRNNNSNTRSSNNSRNRKPL